MQQLLFIYPYAHNCSNISCTGRGGCEYRIAIVFTAHNSLPIHTSFVINFQQFIILQNTHGYPWLRYDTHLLHPNKTSMPSYIVLSQEDTCNKKMLLAASIRKNRRVGVKRI